MLFVSTPSLVISFVLAAFYVANLVFYVMNRERDTDNLVEIATVSCENQQTVLLTVQQNRFVDLEYSCSADFSSINFVKGFGVLNSQFSILNYFRLSLPDITISVLDSGICWKLFSRPPPLG